MTSPAKKRIVRKLYDLAILLVAKNSTQTKCIKACIVTRIIHKALFMHKKFNTACRNLPTGKMLDLSQFRLALA